MATARHRLDKKALEQAAAGPQVVQTLGRVPVVGPGVRAGWRWWFERQMTARDAEANREAVEAYRRAAAPLDALQQRVLDALSRDGIATVPVADLVGEARWQHLRTAAEAWLETPEVRAQEEAFRADALQGNRKTYLVRQYGKGGVLPWASPWVQWSIEPRVLAIVQGYLGMMPRVNYVDLWNTLPLDHEGPDVGSQRWHRDPESARMVKTFLYFTDVDEASGPLVYVRRSRRGDRYGHLWPQEFPAGSHPPPDELERRIPKEEWAVCTVSAGTLVFADTSGFHRGGRASRHRRVVAVTNYVPPACAWPRAFDVDPREAPGDLPPAVRFALFNG